MTDRPNNILIHRHVYMGHDGEMKTGVRVVTRYNYTDFLDLHDEHTPEHCALIETVEKLDPDAVNRLGQRGAIGSIASAAEIEMAISTIRSAHGNLPVQNNLPPRMLDRPLAIDVVADGYLARARTA